MIDADTIFDALRIAQQRRLKAVALVLTPTVHDALRENEDTAPYFFFSGKFNSSFYGIEIFTTGQVDRSCLLCNDGTTLPL